MRYMTYAILAYGCAAIADSDDGEEDHYVNDVLSGVGSEDGPEDPEIEWLSQMNILEDELPSWYERDICPKFKPEVCELAEGAVGVCTVMQTCMPNKGPADCLNGTLIEVCYCRKGYCAYPSEVRFNQEMFSRQCVERLPEDYSCPNGKPEECVEGRQLLEAETVVCDGGLCFCKFDHHFNPRTSECVKEELELQYRMNEVYEACEHFASEEDKAGRPHVRPWFVRPAEWYGPDGKPKKPPEDFENKTNPAELPWPRPGRAPFYDLIGRMRSCCLWTYVAAITFIAGACLIAQRRSTVLPEGHLHLLTSGAGRRSSE